MYNANRKRAYLDATQRNPVAWLAAERIFDTTEEYESRFECDLSAMTLSQSQDMVDGMLGMRTSSKWAKMVTIRNYAEWCLAAGYSDATDNLLKVNLLGLEKLKKQLVSGPTQLAKCLDDIFTPIEEEKIDTIYRVFLWCAFSGVPSDKVLELTPENINFRLMSIIVDGVLYPIYRESISAIDKLIELDTFAYYHPSYVVAENKTIRRERVPGNLLMRGLRGKATFKDTQEYLIGFIKRAEAKGVDVKKLAYAKMRLSGFFYRIREIERSGSEVDLKSFVAEYHGTEVNEVQSRQLREFSDDFNRWKIAFR